MNKRLLLIFSAMLISVSGLIICAEDDGESVVLGLESTVPETSSNADSVIGDADIIQKESLFHPKSAATVALLLGGYAYKKQGTDFVGNWKTMACIALGSGVAGFVPVDRAKAILSGYVPQLFSTVSARRVK